MVQRLLDRTLSLMLPSKTLAHIHSVKDVQQLQGEPKVASYQKALPQELVENSWKRGEIYSPALEPTSSTFHMNSSCQEEQSPMELSTGVQKEAAKEAVSWPPRS